MGEPLRPGTAVRVRPVDPQGHNRAPRYVRGRRGTVVEMHGVHPLPDAVVAGRGPAAEPVYAVAFDAAELWGSGHGHGAGAGAAPHRVVVNLWESYLEEDG